MDVFTNKQTHTNRNKCKQTHSHTDTPHTLSHIYILYITRLGFKDSILYGSRISIFICTLRIYFRDTLCTLNAYIAPINSGVCGPLRKPIVYKIHDRTATIIMTVYGEWKLLIAPQEHVLPTNMPGFFFKLRLGSMTFYLMACGRITGIYRCKEKHWIR